MQHSYSNNPMPSFLNASTRKKSANNSQPLAATQNSFQRALPFQV